MVPFSGHFEMILSNLLLLASLIVLHLPSVLFEVNTLILPYKNCTIFRPHNAEANTHFRTRSHCKFAKGLL
jgi:hypothetical protein